MKIESLTKAENRTGRFTVLFEDGSKVSVSEVQIADFGLYSGREMTDNEYSLLRGKLKLGSTKARAVRILGNRNLSSYELEKRLVSKGESQDTASEAVRWLEGIGAINDAQYAATIVKHYCAKGYGLARIKDELYRRGISRDMWDEALCSLDNMEEAAYYFIDKKLSGSRDKTELRRAADALCRRGFSYEEALEAVNRYLENTEENGESGS
jgi:regulatory protein